ncbi:VOC family protein [Loktanella sp. IMCC34160]|uniref:VOC family protein n=1 Tax=Loktanella sp. IMCC34160 TaxID=2510646 RepID=UPI00101B71DC|nr:VOC family protein [Loktanella sp. IMCC34160]RYG90042.1 VOC family protein [Loktanella sp. IMCC34160]
MIPVLAVDDPESAREMLARVFGFVPNDHGCMALAEQSVAVIRTGDTPSGMLRIPLDHVAFAASDADETCAAIQARGGHLSRSFTPDGPRDIPEFWDNGVRFVFFDGPDGWPLEFCMKNGIPDRSGHDHFAIRTTDIGAAEARLRAIGAAPVAGHRLSTETGWVEVRFLALGADMFEVFDEGPHPDVDPDRGWIGLL